MRKEYKGDVQISHSLVTSLTLSMYPFPIRYQLEGSRSQYEPFPWHACHWCYVNQDVLTFMVVVPDRQIP